MKVWYRIVVRQGAKPSSAAAAVPVRCLSFVMLRGGPARFKTFSVRKTRDLKKLRRMEPVKVEPIEFGCLAGWGLGNVFAFLGPT